MQRIDYFGYDQSAAEGAEEYKTDYKSILGGTIKGGLNYNINENHNVFINSGYFSRQPFMNNGVYINNSNTMNPDLKNEKVLGIEVGYGLRIEKVRANVNLYRTSWKDRIIRVFTSDVHDNRNNPNLPRVSAYANLYGVEQLHTGLEMDFVYYAFDKLNFTGSLSWGDWKYKGNVSATYLDESDNSPIQVLDPATGTPTGEIKKETLYLDGVKVGDAPQFIVNVGFNYEIIKGLKLDGNYRYNDKFYGLVDPENFKTEGNPGAIKLPAFNLFDAGLSYRMEVGKEKSNSVTMRVNVNNIFDTTYISSSRTNYHTSEANEQWKGVDTTNEVMFGIGRTWNLTLRYNF